MSNLTRDYITCSLSAGFGLFSIIISFSIVAVIRRSKPRLHTARHLLISNTCIASVVYCIVQVITYVILIFFPWITSDVACRWRGYFGYMSISAATYSYLVQTISRLLFSVFCSQYPGVVTFKVHYLLILAHWIVVIIIPLPAIITKDIYFRPGELCWVPMRSFIHVMYTLFAYYAVPILAIMFIYIYIYRHIQKTKKQTKLIRHTASQKRDLEVLRNIVILLCIYIAGGIPTVLFLMTSIEFFYSCGIVTFTLVVMIEKLCTILLDRELRSVVKNIISSKNRITSFENSVTRLGDQQKEARLPRTIC